MYVTLGGKPFELTVLPMRLNRQWVTQLRDAITAVIGGTEKLETLEDFIDLLASNSEVEMDLLIAYDALGAKVLPDREWIDSTATDGECYRALKQVAAAAFPKGLDLFRLAPELRPLLAEAVKEGVAKAAVTMSLARRMSSSRRNTAGQPTTSKATSPTSSSASTSTRRRRARSKPPSSNSTAS